VQVVSSDPATASIRDITTTTPIHDIATAIQRTDTAVQVIATVIQLTAQATTATVTRVHDGMCAVTGEAGKRSPVTSTEFHTATRPFVGGRNVVKRLAA
jgi:hypothetical protein